MSDRGTRQHFGWNNDATLVVQEAGATVPNSGLAKGFAGSRFSGLVFVNECSLRSVLVTCAIINIVFF